jgi:hypothetical protein
MGPDAENGGCQAQTAFVIAGFVGVVLCLFWCSWILCCKPKSALRRKLAVQRQPHPAQSPIAESNTADELQEPTESNNANELQEASPRWSTARQDHQTAEGHDAIFSANILEGDNAWISV